VLRTFSKAFGLAGLRVGWTVGASYILDAARSAAIPLSVTEPAQRAAIAALEVEADLLSGVDELIERRGRIHAGLIAAGLTVPEPHGNFVWVAAGAETSAVAAVLEDDGIVGRVLGTDGIRISIGEEESVERLLDSAARVVATLPLAVENARLG
jgi:histidinol-phosphate aminotransferase